MDSPTCIGSESLVQMGFYWHLLICTSLDAPFYICPTIKRSLNTRVLPLVRLRLSNCIWTYTSTSPSFNTDIVFPVRILIVYRWLIILTKRVILLSSSPSFDDTHRMTDAFTLKTLQIYSSRYNLNDHLAVFFQD